MEIPTARKHEAPPIRCVPYISNTVCTDLIGVARQADHVAEAITNRWQGDPDAWRSASFRAGKGNRLRRLHQLSDSFLGQ